MLNRDSSASIGNQFLFQSDFDVYSEFSQLVNQLIIFKDNLI